MAESVKQKAAPKGAAFLFTASKDSHMKITVERSDELLTKVKRYASKHGTTMRALIENGLRHELGVPTVRWVAVEGGLPKGFEVADRAKMIERLMK